MKVRTSARAATLLLLASTVMFGDGTLRAAGTITGVVFEDFNGNGVIDTTATVPNSSGVGATPQAVDRGVAGIEVRAFDSAGSLRGVTTTTALGAYSLAAGGGGPYRIEFTNLPAGYRPSAFAPGASGNGTTVQFVADGNSAAVNLGILDAANFCQNNPTLVTSCFVFGDQLGAFGAQPVVVDFPYAAGSNSPSDVASYFSPAAHALMVPANQLGSIYGLAYASRTNTVYAGAYMKKHAGFGPAGTGAIYAVNPTTGAASLFADLNAIFGGGTAGVDPHDNADYNVDNGDVAWDAVGKIGLGGVEVSADGATVFALNLADRQLYALPTSGPLTPATVRHALIPLDAPGATGLAGADLRPFALQWYRGQLYVGMVNSAESTGSRTDLIAYVYRVNAASLTFSAAPVFQFALAYPRGAVQTFNGTGPGAWQAWRSTFASQSPTGVGTYPQPMLSGLAFDANGNVSIGIRDRAGDQFGFFAKDDPSSQLLWEGVAGGDTLFAAVNIPGDVASGWTLESNAQAGTFGPTAGQGNGEGPGTVAGFGEYYFADALPLLHREITGGATMQVPGFPDVVSSAINPGLSVRTGGFVWFNETTGGRSKGYVLYDTGTAVPPATFSKANGFGEVVAVCQAAPIEIGNRVWDDVDGDGIQDPGEAALDGVVVELLAPGGAVLGTATTANGGNYYFSSSAGTTTGNAVYNIAGLTPLTSGYVLRIATGQAALGGRLVTRANSDGSANGDSRDSDGVIVGASAQIPVSTGAAGANDHTFDFGFTRVVVPTLSLGNFVWTDTNNDGVVSAGETGIDGVTVRLLNATGTVVLATQTTAGGGFYLFTGLTPGDYVVEAVTPVGYTSSSGGGTEPASDPDNDVNNDDNGTTTGAVVRSLPVTLTPGGEPVNDGDANPDSNLSVDFGFVPGGGGGGGGVEIGGADICLQQTLPGSVRAGDQLALTYTTVNRGPNSATDVMIEGVIPQFTTLVSATPTSGGVCTVTGGMLDCRWPGLTPMGPAGDRTVRVVLQVNAGVPAGSTIWAWFMAASATVDPYPACNMVDGYVFVVDSATPAVDLAITGTARVGAQTGAAVAGLVGESVAVRFAVTNAGASPARGTYALLLDDANGLIVRGAVASQGAVGVANATAGTWDTGAIAPGATATLDLTVAAANGAAVRLQAVRVTGAPADPNAVNDSADVTIDGIGPGGGRSVAVGNVDGVAGGEIIAAGGRGDSPQVFVFSGAGVAARPFYAFDRAFLGGVRLASCDVNGDGIDELIAAQGPGGGRVRVLALTGGAVTDLVSFDAYETGFTGGVNVACGDLDGDGRAEVVVGPDSGRAPDVKVFSISGASAVVTTQFQAYEPAFTGGVRVSAARFTGSGLVGAFNVATMPGPGRATELRLWQVIGASAARTAAVALFGTTGGAQVLLGDVNGDAGLDLLVMPDGGAPVLVQAYSLTTGALVLSAPTGTGGYTGLNAAIGRLAGGPGVPELVVGSGPGMAPTVSSFVITPGGAVSQRLGFTALEQP